MRLARTHGVGRAVVNVWWLADAMVEAAREAAPEGLELVFSRERELMDTAGGLALARQRGLIDLDEPLLVLNGDGIVGLDLEPLFERHLHSHDLVTLALLPHLDPSRYSRVILDDGGAVVAIRPPGPPAPDEVPMLYPGAMVVSAQALRQLPLEPVGVGPALWSPAMAEGRLGGVLVSGHWREVGTPLDYLDSADALLRGECVIHPDADVSATATVGSSLIGRGVTVGPDAVVAGSVLSHGVRVGEAARVARSIALGPVVCEARTTTAGRFLGAPHSRW